MKSMRSFDHTQEGARVASAHEDDQHREFGGIKVKATVDSPAYSLPWGAGERSDWDTRKTGQPLTSPVGSSVTWSPWLPDCKAARSRGLTQEP